MKKVKVSGFDFHVTGFHSFIEVNDQNHLDALVYFYGQRHLVVSSSTGGAEWQHTAPMLVHQVQVPEEFVDGGLDGPTAQAVLTAARGEAEDAARKTGLAKGPLRFDLMGGSADGSSISIVVWHEWTDAMR